MEKIETQSFMDRAAACTHTNLYPNYGEDYGCGTPYCRAYEYHCKDCGAFISECGCGSNNGYSGWSYKRWKAYDMKKGESK